MDNLHAPTIPSGPSSAPTANGSGADSSLKELETKKDAMEAELRALSSVLESHGVDMSTSLITPDGFPRADLDVAQIRTTRSRVIHLRNDYKALMSLIEKKIHEHFANQTQPEFEGRSLNTQTLTTTNRRNTEALDIPFAKVNSVENGSPAAEAGLLAGDEIRNFGYVNKDNNNNLRRLADVVNGNEGHNVLVKVSRIADSRREELQLTLTPRRDWGGRGMLGCHVLPL